MCIRDSLWVDTTAAGTPTAAADLKGDDLNDAANAALERGDFQVAVSYTHLDVYKRQEVHRASPAAFFDEA